MIQQFTFTGLGRQIDAKGVFFRYEYGADPSAITDVKLTIDGNFVGVFSIGDAIELPAHARRWEIVPVSPNCTGTVKVGNAKITSTKLAGVVSTIDGGKARVMSGNSLAGHCVQNAVAGQYSRTQIWNPPSSTRNVIVNRVTVSSGSEISAYMWFNGAQLASVNSALSSKKSGTAVTILATMRSDTTAAAPDTVGALKAFSLGPSSNYEFVPSEPIVLTPGYGLVITSATINADLRTSFECWEESV